MRALLDLVNVIYDPIAVFERVREKPRFWAPFLGLAALQIVIGFLMIPYNRAAMRSVMSTAGGPGPDPSVFLALGVFSAPIGLALFLVLSAAVLWILVSVLAAGANFKQLLSVVTYVGITAIVAQLAGLVVLILGGGPESVTSMSDLRASFGLDLLLSERSGALGALLSAVNPFSIWALVLTGLGVSVTHKTSRALGMGVAAVLLAVGALLQAGFAMIGMGRGA
ncbi:MAG: hypothetical protein KatS3mg081_1234 [Gemmatimonadales bacterium]|nr:MAG: hypothetical protein KatS3mg081_1234 [Gemmatimonadales bacterium]